MNDKFLKNKIISVKYCQRKWFETHGRRQYGMY